MPAAVLFNGGFFTPALARTRVLDALESWFGSRPMVLENERPEAAVAIGAAFYARLRPTRRRRSGCSSGPAVRGPTTSHRTTGAAPSAICVMPRGTDEGTTLALERTFDVITNQPIAFTLYSSISGTTVSTGSSRFDGSGRGPPPRATRHRLRYGKRSRRVSLAVGLRVVFTETGTLELWCESRERDHRWRLAFNLRAAKADPLEITEASADPAPNGRGRRRHAESLEQAGRLIERVLQADGPRRRRRLHSRRISKRCSVSASRRGRSARSGDSRTVARRRERTQRSPAHEVRWLNLTGFCVRPGFGAAADAWRISELRTV